MMNSARTKLMLIMAVMAIFSSAAIAPPSPACEAGVCDGTVTTDGRPICWKLRVQVDIVNEVQYFEAGVEHHDSLGPATFSYLGVGPHDDDHGGPARFGVNSRGLAIGFNAFNAGAWDELHHFALGFAPTVAQVDIYLESMTDLGTIHYYSDALGQAVLWESDRDPSGHWQYDTQAPARAEVWRDFDDDGDEISYAGWVGRANTIDMSTEGMDSLRYGEDDRTAAAQTVPGRLIDSDMMDPETLAREYFRHDVLARDNTVSSNIVHGVLETEDARLTTMWTALGHSEAAIFVPLWLHGIEVDGPGVIPDHLDHGSGECVYSVAKGLIAAAVDEDSLQARTLPVESRFFELVTDLLLPAWRARDWNDADSVAVIGHEMKRVQERMDADAYSLLNCQYLQGVGNFAPLGSVIDDWLATDLTVTLTATAVDVDGDIIETIWDYGDGQTGISDTHDYDDYGSYLVSFTAMDDDSVSHTDWEFVTLTNPWASAPGQSGPAGDGSSITCYPNPFNPLTVIAYDLPLAGRAHLSVYDLTGRRVRALLTGEFMSAGRHEASWDGRDDEGRQLAAGVYHCRLVTESHRATERLVLIK